MVFSLCVLGSGSLGNSTLLRLNGGGDVRHVLLDAGLSPRQTMRRLEPHAVEPEQIDALLLTHLDGDHFHPGWSRVLRRVRMPVHVHRRHARRAVRRGIPVACLECFDEGLDPFAETSVRGIGLAHDQLGTTGFRIEHAGHRLGYATDLGRVTTSLLHFFEGVDVLAIESNYDRRMQAESDRPEFLRRRIMGGCGHLSNDQALEAVVRLDAAASLERIVLLHLSRECNHPNLIRRLYAERARHLLGRMTISSQYRPTPVVEVRRMPRVGRQMTLI